MSMEELQVAYKNSSPDALENARRILCDERERLLAVANVLRPGICEGAVNEYALLGSTVEVVESAA